MLVELQNTKYVCFNGKGRSSTGIPAFAFSFGAHAAGPPAVAGSEGGDTVGR